MKTQEDNGSGTKIKQLCMSFTVSAEVIGLWLYKVSHYNLQYN